MGFHVGGLNGPPGTGEYCAGRRWAPGPTRTEKRELHRVHGPGPVPDAVAVSPHADGPQIPDQAAAARGMGPAEGEVPAEGSPAPRTALDRGVHVFTPRRRAPQWRQ